MEGAMRRNYVALISFVIGVAGTVFMYEILPDSRRQSVPTDSRFVSAAHDVSTVGDPI
jgi:hypothetical protein